MNTNEYNNYIGQNQEMAYNYYESVNNNLPTMPDNNLIDLSHHAAQAYDLSMPEEIHIEPNYNKNVRTKGAKKMISERHQLSHQSDPSIPIENPNCALDAMTYLMLPVYNPVLNTVEPHNECNNDTEIQTNQLPAFEPITPVGSPTNNDDNNNSDEVEQLYSALDDSTISKIHKWSQINKAIIFMVRNKLPIAMLPTNTVRGQCLFDTKGFQKLLKCLIEIFLLMAPVFLKKDTNEKIIQTEESKIPPVLKNKTTQTEDEYVPRAKNPRLNKSNPNKEPSKEQTARQYPDKHHNHQTSDQMIAALHQQEQYYVNKQVIPQLPMDQSYTMQAIPDTNNMQQPMVQYGMPYVANTANTMMQRAESGNHGVPMEATHQYGMPHTQTSNMMKRANYGMSGMYMAQPGLPQYDPSTVQVQIADVSMNRMQAMMQARPYHQANATVTATVPPTFYQRHKSANSKEMPREMQMGMQRQMPGQLQNEMQKEIHSERPREMSREMPREMSKEVRREIPREMLKEMSREIPGEISREMPSGVPRKMSRELQKELQRGIPKEMLREMQTELPREMPRELVKEMAREIPRKKPREMQQNQPSMQALIRPTAPSLGCERRAHGFYEKAQPPCSLYPCRIPNCQDQYYNSQFMNQ